MKKKYSIKTVFFLASCMLATIVTAQLKPANHSSISSSIKIAANQRYFVRDNGKPFFWLGDTGWLLFKKLSRQESVLYLEDRKKKGFNVIQVMVLHEMKQAVNFYGDSALIDCDAAQPKTTPGNDFNDSIQYDFWDHIDFVIDEAARRGIYMALVPVWGSNLKGKLVNEASARKYATFLANRYKHKPNIIWLNGGDIPGSEGLSVWNIIGNTIKSIDSNHLMTFHPRGRSTSSTWFHQEKWLDFNMFQSGHKDYAQDTVAPRIGEDNWKFVIQDYALSPVKPTMDGEPSYEQIPHGLHDTISPLWNANDVRRYAYWSVLSGGAGFTYGHNAVMQFHNGIGTGDFNCKQSWREGIKEIGSSQMQYLKQLMLSTKLSNFIPDQSMVQNQGSRYDYIVASRNNQMALLYTYTGRSIKVNMGKIDGAKLSASWYDPRTGKYMKQGIFKNVGTVEFDAPGDVKAGNDWVLVLSTI